MSSSCSFSSSLDSSASSVAFPNHVLEADLSSLPKTPNEKCKWPAAMDAGCKQMLAFSKQDVVKLSNTNELACDGRCRLIIRKDGAALYILHANGDVSLSYSRIQK